MGLINLIPIVGQLVVFGWMLTALDNLRAGQPVLPPAGFSYIGRGVNLFVVYLVYALVFGVVLAAIIGAGFGIVASQQATGVGVLLIVVGYGLLLVCIFGLYLLSPPIILATERGGIGGGLNLPAVIATASADFNSALYAGLFALLAYLIGGVGAILCGIGQIFTLPYGYAVLAGVVHHYERSVGIPATSTPVA